MTVAGNQNERSSVWSSVAETAEDGVEQQHQQVEDDEDMPPGLAEQCAQLTRMLRIAIPLLQSGQWTIPREALDLFQ